MSDLNDLYQQLILDHNARPRNYGTLPEPTHQAHGHNPLCGDDLHLSLIVQNATIQSIQFTGKGCAISKASASLMTEFLKNKTLEQAMYFFEKFRGLVMSDLDEPQDISELGKLGAFAGVREFPMRVKCATLAWHTLRAALEQTQEAVSTES